MYWIFYIISWIQWDDWDLSLNMVNSIIESDLLFVEEVKVFNRLIQENNIQFTWKLVEMNNNFNLKDYKKEILSLIINWKNIWLFESSWAACFIDPWYEIVEYIYILREKFSFEVKPIPWSSALTLAISCSWFNIVSFQFLWFLWKKSKNDILNSSIPSIYFNQIDNIDKLNECISFMKDISNRKAFVWINLWKIWVDKSNTFIRWRYCDVYEKINGIYSKEDKIVDLTFIFN